MSLPKSLASLYILHHHQLPCCFFLLPEAPFAAAKNVYISAKLAMQSASSPVHNLVKATDTCSFQSCNQGPAIQHAAVETKTMHLLFPNISPMAPILMMLISQDQNYNVLVHDENLNFLSHIVFFPCR